MTVDQLQTIQSNRLPEETINDTKNRLEQEGKLQQPGNQDSQVPSWVIESDSSGQPEDEEGFFPEDLVIPRIKIVQPTCRIEGAKEGTFRNMVTGEESSKLENVVFLSRKNGRVLFTDNDFSGERRCWSWDGIAPATDDVFAKTEQSPPSDFCIHWQNGRKISVCAFSMWNNDVPDDESPAPKCRETITFLGLMSDLSPFWISFHGTGIPPVKNFISTIYLKKKQAMFQEQDCHLRDFRISLSLKLQINAKGKFYLPCFKIEGEIKGEEQKLLTACFETLKDKNITETFEAENQE